MPGSFLVIVTGLPASGKTSLAQAIAARHRAPLFAKDAVKEALLDTLGAHDAAASRLLSDASFGVLACVAAELARRDCSCVLEGNFRRGEHESLLAAATVGRRTLVQILCRIDEPTRRARLAARARDASRHPGHRDVEQAGRPAARETDAFLDLPGAQLVHTGGDPAAPWPDLDRLLENPCTEVPQHDSRTVSARGAPRV